jgi:hypothetical protein
MTPQFLVAGALAMLGAAIHGGAGEVLIVRKVVAGELPSSRFGGPAATRAMIRVSWHLGTLTFAAFGSALATCGFLGPGDACRGIGVVAASSFTAFLVLVVVSALHRPRRLFLHPGPAMFLAVAALTWWGTL